MSYQVKCEICLGTCTSEKSYDDAVECLDHSVGTSKGRPCPGGPGAKILYIDVNGNGSVANPTTVKQQTTDIPKIKTPKTKAQGK